MGRGEINGRRLDIILDLWREGKRANQIEEALEIRRDEGQEKNERLRQVGKESEERVREALTCSPCTEVIKEIHRTTPGERYDRRGIDFFVYLDVDELGIDFSKIKVQVKSSDQGIEAFKFHLGDKHEVPEGRIDDWLRERKFVILNGQREIEVIGESFLRQVGEIIEYQAKNRQRERFF